MAFGVLLGSPLTKALTTEANTQVGDRVTFPRRSVFLPPSEEPLTLDESWEGTVIEFSDSGTEAQFFAVVEVVRKQTVIVPVSELQISPAAN